MNHLTSLLVFSGIILSSFIMVPKHQRIIFLGDSLTQAGNEPGGYISLLRDSLNKQAGSNIELIGAGVGGNRVRELLARIEKDVISQKPDWVYIMVGINDVGFFKWHPEDGGTPADQYELALTYIVKRIVQKGGRVLLITPTVIEERLPGKNPMDAELDQYAGIVKKVASATGSRFCDMRTVCQDWLRVHNPEQKPKGVLTKDGVHMLETGNRLLAGTLMPFVLEQK